MRAKLLLVGGLALLLAACGGKSNNHAPPPLNKQLLTGKWKSSSEMQFITGYDFAEGGALKMSVRGMDQPVPGRYSWSGDRDLALKYEANEGLKKAYAAAAKSYKEEVRERVKKGTLPERALGGILDVVKDELPAEETFRAGLSERPHLLMLTDPNGTTRRFEKAE